jgi:hypothetical protein
LIFALYAGKVISGAGMTGNKPQKEKDAEAGFFLKLINAIGQLPLSIYKKYKTFWYGFVAACFLGVLRFWTFFIRILMPYCGIALFDRWNKSNS